MAVHRRRSLGPWPSGRHFVRRPLPRPPTQKVPAVGHTGGDVSTRGGEEETWTRTWRDLLAERETTGAWPPKRRPCGGAPLDAAARGPGRKDEGAVATNQETSAGHGWPSRRWKLEPAMRLPAAP